MSGSHVSPEPASNQTALLLDETFESALRGDAKALEMLLTLLKTRYGNLIFRKLRVHRGRSHTATMEDIFQESMVELIEQIKSGALAELEESERRDLVGYFQSLCDRRLENLRKARLDPLFDRNKSSVPFDLSRDKRIGEKVPIPGDGRKTERLQRHQGLLQNGIARLDPFDRLVLERHLAGVPYALISKETGTKVSTLESLVSRIKHSLAERILHQSPTARIHQRGDESSAPGTSSRSLLPTPQEIREAIRGLPVDTQRAIEFIHLKGGTVEQLAKSLGARGVEKAQARLKKGYESLSLKLEVSFPDSFSLLNP